MTTPTAMAGHKPNFDADLAWSRKYEAVLRPALALKWHAAVRDATSSEQFEGWDAAITIQKPAGDLTVYHVDFKVDRYSHRSGHFAVELAHFGPAYVRLGSAMDPTKHATHLMYCSPPRGLAYILTPAELRRLVFERGVRPWVSRNPEYVTTGLLVAERELKLVARLVDGLPVMDPEY